MNNFSRALLTACFLLTTGAVADTESKEKPNTAALAEMHEQMAEAHKKAADCLKKGSAPAECRKDLRAAMKKAHKNIMDNDDEMECPMMEDHHHSHKEMHD